jgi:hypothetical protein
MRDKHCAFAQLSNGRCKASCYLIIDGVDCTGNGNRIMEGQREIPVSGGFIDGTHLEIVHDHDKGTYTINRVYKPDVNTNCQWGVSSNGK